MSAQLQSDQTEAQDYCDDRESALWVLLWVALRFTLTHGKAGPGNHNNDLPTHLTMFDHAVLRPDGSIAGGNLKIHLLDHYSPTTLSFADRPALDSLVETLTETFSTRYSKAPSAEKIREMKALFQKQGVPSIEEIMQHQTATLYQHQIDKIHRKGWLTETIREYLAKPGWPETDKPLPQETQSPTGTKRKREQMGLLSR